MRFIAGFFACLLLLGCTSFAYRYYGLAGVSYSQGTLLGPKERDDLPFNHCAPNDQTQHPCVIMFAKDFFAFKQEYEDLRVKLKACEKEKILTP